MSAQIVCFGELLMRLSTPDHQLFGQAKYFISHFGGAEANVAANLAGFGNAAKMVSTVPANALGQAVIADFRRAGVDVSGIKTSETGRLGLYFLAPGAVTRPSEIIYDREYTAFANAVSASYDWPLALADAALFHVCGITPALCVETEQAAIDACHTADVKGIKVSFDFNFRQKLWDARGANPAPILDRLASTADILFGNDRDLSLVLGRDFSNGTAEKRFAQSSAAAFAHFPKLSLIASTCRTHSAVADQTLQGLLARREGVIVSRVHELPGIVDRIGTGDAFAAGILHGVVHGFDDAKMIEFATASAALKHSIPGDYAAISQDAVFDAIRDQGFDVKR
jgi:2-dehydro-3-deoxygluconokinase